MNENVKERKGLTRAIREQKLHHGEILELDDGTSVYVIPVIQLKKLEEKDIASIKEEIEAREIVNEAEAAMAKHISEGWTEKNFQDQFREAREKIRQFLSRKGERDKVIGFFEKVEQESVHLKKVELKKIVSSFFQGMGNVLDLGF